MSFPVWRVTFERADGETLTYELEESDAASAANEAENRVREDYARDALGGNGAFAVCVECITPGMWARPDERVQLDELRAAASDLLDAIAGEPALTYSLTESPAFTRLAELVGVREVPLPQPLRTLARYTDTAEGEARHLTCTVVCVPFSSDTASTSYPQQHTFDADEICDNVRAHFLQACGLRWLERGPDGKAYRYDLLGADGRKVNLTWPVRALINHLPQGHAFDGTFRVYLQRVETLTETVRLA